MKRTYLLEAIVSSLDDAMAAAAGGADRFELCSALALGGLTPSIGTVRAIRRHVTVPIMAMVRPREGGMSYGKGEFEGMLLDAEALVAEGVRGLVFGFLTPAGEVDVARCRQLLRIAEQGSGSRKIETVFHRAFDVTSDPRKALEQLVDLGVTRILTSGRAPTALEGISEIRKAVEQADGRIEVLPGGGIDLSTVTKVIRETGVDQVHLYLTRTAEDRSVSANPDIYFGAFVPEGELEYRVVDQSLVERVRAELDSSV